MNRRLIRPSLAEIKDKMNREREHERESEKGKMHPPCTNPVTL